jgi:hypothetical protein
VANGIYTWENWMKVALGDPPGDGRPTHPKVAQLPPSYASPLPSSERRNANFAESVPRGGSDFTSFAARAARSHPQSVPRNL